MMNVDQIVRITPSTMQTVLAALHRIALRESDDPDGWTVADRAELSETIGSLIATLNKEGYS